MKTNELGGAAAVAAAAGGSASSSSASLSPASAAARSQAAEVGRGGGLRVADGGRAAVPDGLAVPEGGGRALLNSYGSIVRYDLAHGEVRVVDNGSMVAWTESMDYKIGLASQKGGMLTKLVKSAASGEGIVCRFTGPGTVFVQTRSFSALARTIAESVPSNKRPPPST